MYVYISDIKVSGRSNDHRSLFGNASRLHKCF